MMPRREAMRQLKIAQALQDPAARALALRDLWSEVAPGSATEAEVEAAAILELPAVESIQDLTARVRSRQDLWRAMGRSRE